LIGPSQKKKLKLWSYPKIEDSMERWSTSPFGFCGEPGFAFWLMALLCPQQHPPLRFDVELNRGISIICNFGWIDASMVCDQTDVGSAILEAWGWYQHEYKL